MDWKTTINEDRIETEDDDDDFELRGNRANASRRNSTMQSMERREQSERETHGNNDGNDEAAQGDGERRAGDGTVTTNV